MEELKKISELAEKLDSDKMLDSLRSFVDDLVQSFTQFDFDVPEWMDEIGSTHWDGILCLGMGGSGAAGNFLKLFLIQKVKSLLSLGGIMKFQNGGIKIG